MHEPLIEFASMFSTINILGWMASTVCCGQLNLNKKSGVSEKDYHSMKGYIIWVKNGMGPPAFLFHFSNMIQHVNLSKVSVKRGIFFLLNGSSTFCVEENFLFSGYSFDIPQSSLFDTESH